MQRTLILFLISLVLVACGKKGPLVPPEALVPAAITDLAVAQQGEYFQLSWSGPARLAGGGRLTDLAGFELFRREVLPAAEDCEQCPSAYSLLRAVDLEYLRDAERLGSRFFVHDNGVATGKTYQYKIISREKDGTPSRGSNKVRRQKVPPPLPPVLQAISSPTGINLEFVAIPAEGGTIIGYNIYRSRNSETLSSLPLNEQPVAGNTYEDLRVQRGSGYRYIARTVARIAGETVESGPSNEVIGSLTEPE
jgi:predicted small lipoprotein YifL